MNTLFESLRMALQGLVANKIRAALTMLGIIIGVGAVITLVSIGDGFSAFVNSEFESLGSNVVFIRADPEANNNTGQPLTLGDVSALENALGVQGIKALSPVYQRNAVASYNGAEKVTMVSGVAPNYAQIRSYDVAVGRFFTPDEEATRGRVAVIGSTVADEFFPDNAYPIGETIRLNDANFEVIGLLAEKGASGPLDNDNLIFVPISTAQTRLFNAETFRGEYVLSTIEVQAVSEEQTDAAIAGITAVLRQNHRLEADKADDFNITSQAGLLDTVSIITSTLTLFLGAIAGISLLVGGIGIMNIMLVSVTERTREIGLRKAIGAGKNDILFQFIIEAMFLALVGGLVGIIIGVVGSQLLAPILSLSIAVNPTTLALAAGFSAAVGLFFGIYPAMRAANLQPIDALRYE